MHFLENRQGWRSTEIKDIVVTYKESFQVKVVFYTSSKKEVTERRMFFGSFQ